MRRITLFLALAAITPTLTACDQDKLSEVAKAMEAKEPTPPSHLREGDYPMPTVQGQPPTECPILTNEEWHYELRNHRCMLTPGNDPRIIAAQQVGVTMATTDKEPEGAQIDWGLMLTFLVAALIGLGGALLLRWILSKVSIKEEEPSSKQGKEPLPPTGEDPNKEGEVKAEAPRKMLALPPGPSEEVVRLKEELARQEALREATPPNAKNEGDRQKCMEWVTRLVACTGHVWTTTQKEEVREVLEQASEVLTALKDEKTPFSAWLSAYDKTVVHEDFLKEFYPAYKRGLRKQAA